MRIRLMLDAELDEAAIELLQKLIEHQPAAYISIEGVSANWGARLMGAKLVETAK